MQHQSSHSRAAKTVALGMAAWWLTKSVLRSKRRFDLAGRTVLITGGSRGLGLALAHECVRKGANVSICARSKEELDIAATELERSGATVHRFLCDLTDPEEITELITDVESTSGPIDLLINNAGTIIVGPAQTMTADDFREAMDLNFWAAVHTTLAVAPKMKVRGFGRIVNIGSVGGKTPVPHLAPYCASKFALVGFSGSMRAELSKDGILVTTVNPGLMQTGSPRNASFKGNHQAEYAWFSIGDATPGLSMNVATAARRIIKAAIDGDAEVMVGLPAKIAAVSYGVAPSLHLELAALANRALPKSDGQDQTIKRGSESESAITRSFVRHFGHKAEQEYNQLNT